MRKGKREPYRLLLLAQTVQNLSLKLLSPAPFVTVSLSLAPSRPGLRVGMVSTGGGGGGGVVAAAGALALARRGSADIPGRTD